MTAVDPTTEETIRSAMRDAVCQKLQSMPRNKRLCIMLCYHNEMSDAECAEALGITKDQATACREVAWRQLKETARRAGEMI